MTMQSIKMTLYGQDHNVFPITGAFCNGKQLVGVFLHEEDALSPLADDQAFAIVDYSKLTPEQQAAANANSESIS